MAYSKTTAYRRIKGMNSRIRAVVGGTSASKTISILIFLIAKAQCDTSKTLTSIVAESFPHLRRGAMRDFLQIMKEHNYYQDARWNKTDSVYTFETGSQIEFFSVDQSEKVRGARRDRLFINEANNITFNAFEELEVRTKDFIFMDWNPTNEFWYYTLVKGVRSDVEEITLTYKDNESLSPAIVASIEQRKNRKGWWTVYGLGQLGEVDGRIYKDWAIVDNVPHEARLERYGLDFGFSNDPTSIVAVYYYNGGYILDEICFTKGLSNKQIADILLDHPLALVVADSAEPKSIADIKGYGVNIVRVAKTRGETKNESFVKWSIGLVQEQRISVTRDSANILNEYRNYLWMTDKDGVVLNEPEHQFSHSMDAIRYAMTSIVPSVKRRMFIPSSPRRIRSNIAV